MTTIGFCEALWEAPEAPEDRTHAGHEWQVRSSSAAVATLDAQAQRALRPQPTAASGVGSPPLRPGPIRTTSAASLSLPSRPANRFGIGSYMQREAATCALSGSLAPCLCVLNLAEC